MRRSRQRRFTRQGVVNRYLKANMVRHEKAAKRIPRGRLFPVEKPKPGESSGQAGGTAPVARDPRPSANLRTEEQERLVQEALSRFPNPQVRSIVELRFFQDLSLREIAHRLQLTYEQVRDRYQQGMRWLKRELGESHE